MKYISEVFIKSVIEANDNDPGLALSASWLLDECDEINPWKPIYDAPKDRAVLLLSENGACAIEGSFVDLDGGFWIQHLTYDEIFQTYFCELPEPPK